LLVLLCDHPIDDASASYRRWREACEDVWAADRSWSSAGSETARAEAYAVVQHALDRESAAAESYRSRVDAVLRSLPARARDAGSAGVAAHVTR
jgi:hypothetical protein